MKSFTFITALLLCSLSWISVSVCQTQTVEVQSGEEVTLHCSNMSKNPTHTFWSRLVNRSEISCISSMYGSDGDAEYCDGFKNGNFKMSSNVSTVSLKITQVDISDSGLYFCGFYLDGRTVLKVIDLNVPGHDEVSEDVNSECKKESDGITKLTSVILAGLTIFLLMVVIGLVVKIKELQTAPNEEQNTPQSENLGSENLNYAALSFNPKPKKKRRPLSGREMEPNVIYAATR